ncbi:MAG: ATP-binding protein [Bacillota bacterium]
MSIDYEQWERIVLQGERENIDPNHIIKNSWFRSMDYGIDPMGVNGFAYGSESYLTKLYEENELLFEIAEPYIQNMFAIIHELKEVNISLFSPDGYLIRLWVDGFTKEQLNNTGIRTGICCKEEVMGTTAPGLAIQLSRPVLVYGYEHYLELLHPMACAAAPIRDANGETRGVLNISLSKDDYNISIYGMLIAAVQGIEREFYHIAYEEKIKELNNQLEKAVGEERKAKDALSEISNQKDEFFSIVSHELRSPTAIINSATQMLLSKYYEEDISPSARKLVNKIKQNSYRLLRLINNFLDITKIEEGFVTMNYSNVDIVKLTKAIVDSLQFFASNKNLELVYETSLEGKILALDMDKYERILLNLISNAFKFTPSKKQIQVRIDQHGEYVRVSVKDEGIGIPKSKLEQIFNRFIQVDSTLSRRSEGTGIGLSLVKALTENMNGKLEVNSIYGEGSEFVVYLMDKMIEEENDCAPITSSLEIAEKIHVEFSDIYAIE